MLVHFADIVLLGNTDGHLDLLPVGLVGEVRLPEQMELGNMDNWVGLLVADMLVPEPAVLGNTDNRVDLMARQVAELWMPEEEALGDTPLADTMDVQVVGRRGSTTEMRSSDTVIGEEMFLLVFAGRDTVGWLVD